MSRTSESWFFNVICNKDLLQLIVSFQHGHKYYEITDGDLASNSGWLSLIKERYLFLSFTTYAMDYAAQNGHLEIVKWLHINGKERCTKNAMDYTAQNGHLETVKWLHQNRKEGCTTYAMDYAAQNGHLEMIKWLHQNRKEGCTRNAMDAAARNGSLPDELRGDEARHRPRPQGRADGRRADRQPEDR